MSSTDSSPALRLRVFAGPNGAGKSTIIKTVREYLANGRRLDFGVYVNADDIAVLLRNNRFRFRDYKISTTAAEFASIAEASGLVGARFPEEEFRRSYRFSSNRVYLLRDEADEALAQIIADFLRKKLLKEKLRFSFETVFSHPGKLDIMREAVAAGYKVYLYFVATESPEINIERVRLRVSQNGHDVPVDRIRSRYVRSLDLLFPAAQLAYQAYFFDNSGESSRLFAHFKVEHGKKTWDPIDTADLPEWFLEYYFEKVSGDTI